MIFKLHILFEKKDFEKKIKIGGAFPLSITHSKSGREEGKKNIWDPEENKAELLVHKAESCTQWKYWVCNT